MSAYSQGAQHMPVEMADGPGDEFAQHNQGLGQHSDAAKALLHLNNVIDLPFQGSSTPNGSQADARLGSFGDMLRSPPGMPIMLMQKVEGGVTGGIGNPSNSAAQMNGVTSGMNTNNRRAADAQLQLASALQIMTSPQSGQDRGQKQKKRKRGGGKEAPPSAVEQEQAAGSQRGDVSSTTPMDSRPNPEAHVLQQFQLPPTLPQYQTQSAAPFPPHQIAAGSAPFLLAPTVGSFHNGDPTLGMNGTNGAILTGNGLFAGAPFTPTGAAPPGMLHSVMSQFALGVGATGILATMPGGAPNGTQANSQPGVGHVPHGTSEKRPSKPSGFEKEDGNAGSRKGKEEKSEGKSGRKQRFYKSLSCNYWNSLDDQDNEGAGSDEGNMDITTPWRCEVCNIFFTSAQALGGHRINSTDHKQRCEKLRRGDTASLPGTPRLSLHVYSNEETADKGKRTRLPPMAQMAGFDRVLLGFPPDVRKSLARIQSPAAYFSSCSLEVFKRHEKFGNLGDLIINKYFTSLSDTFESMMQNPRAIPEVSQAGFGTDMADEVHNELKIFARMLLTKKKFLDINRRAVSKRIKGIRKAGGERLKEFNQKKARHASMASSQADPNPMASAPDVSSLPQALPPAVVPLVAPLPAEIGGAVQMAPPMESYPRAVF